MDSFKFLRGYNFFHPHTNTYHGLLMSNPPYHDSNISNPLTGISPSKLSNYNGLWTIHTYSELNKDYLTRIIIGENKSTDETLCFTATKEYFEDDAAYCEISANPRAGTPDQNFYFKPVVFQNFTQYFEICIDIHSRHYVVGMRKLADGSFNVRLQEYSMEAEYLDQTLFTLTPTYAVL